MDPSLVNKPINNYELTSLTSGFFFDDLHSKKVVLMLVVLLYSYYYKSITLDEQFVYYRPDNQAIFCLFWYVFMYDIAFHFCEFLRNIAEQMKKKLFVHVILLAFFLSLIENNIFFLLDTTLFISVSRRFVLTRESIFLVYWNG